MAALEILTIIMNIRRLLHFIHSILLPPSIIIDHHNHHQPRSSQQHQHLFYYPQFLCVFPKHKQNAFRKIIHRVQFATRMSTTHGSLTSSVDRILPPNVSGRCRGLLEFTIQEINFKGPTTTSAASTTTTKTFVGCCTAVQAKIIWWGESFQSGAICK